MPLVTSTKFTSDRIRIGDIVHILGQEQCVVSRVPDKTMFEYKRLYSGMGRFARIEAKLWVPYLYARDWILRLRGK